MISSLLLKPAGPDCNMDCTYCFYKCKSELLDDSAHRMSDETVDAIIGRLLEQGDGTYNIVFQGGEPSLCGLDFFRAFIDKVNSLKTTAQSVGYCLQTNGLLIDDDFCSFLADNRFLVGLSYDGTEAVNDSYRTDYAGHGTATRVLETANILKRYGVNFNTLSVVTKENVGRAAKLYDALKNIGSGYMQFIPCIETDETGQVRDFCMTPEEYGDFLCESFELWYNGGNPTEYIRFFEETLIAYATYRSPACSQQCSCAVAPVIEYDGSVYPCDFFVQEDKYLGNITELKLSDIEQSSIYVDFRAAKWRNVNTECRSCKWRGLCFGDCCKNRILPQEKSYFCESYKHFYEYSNNKYKALKKKIYGQRPELMRTERGIGRNDSCPCGSGDKYKNCCMNIKGIR